MSELDAALGCESLGVLDTETDFDQWLAAAAADGGMVFALILHARITGEDTAPEETPLGCEADGALDSGDEGHATETRLFWSDGELITGPGDDPADTSFEPRLDQALRLDRSFPLSPLAGNRLAFNVASIDIRNEDGALDRLAEVTPVDGRRARVLMGKRGRPFSEYREVFDGFAVTLDPGEAAAALVMRGVEHLCDVPILADRYESDIATVAAAGAAAVYAESDNPEIAGLVVPRLFGQCYNVSPRLEDTANLIFRVNARAVTNTNQVYDRGALLTDAGVYPDLGDYPTRAALIAATVDPGEFATCNAEGIFRVGSLASNSVITADVEGDGDSSGYAQTPGAIALLMLEDIMKFPADRIDAASFHALDRRLDILALPNSISWLIGLYIDGDMTVAEFLDLVLGSVGAIWGDIDSTGRIGCALLDPPEDASAFLSLAPEELEPVKRLALPEPVFPPWWRVRVGHTKNWTVQTGEDLAGSVTQARRQFLGQEYRATDPAQDALVLARHPGARDVGIIPTLLQGAGAAAFFAQRWLAMYGADRALFEAVNRRQGWGLLPGRGVEIAAPGYPRLGLDQGDMTRAIAVGYDAKARETTLQLWR